MPELSVVVVAQDNEQRAVLQVLVDGTSVARVVHTCASYPGSPPIRFCAVSRARIQQSFWWMFLAIITPWPCAPSN